MSYITRFAHRDSCSKVAIQPGIPVCYRQNDTHLHATAFLFFWRMHTIRGEYGRVMTLSAEA